MEKSKIIYQPLETIEYVNTEATIDIADGPIPIIRGQPKTVAFEYFPGDLYCPRKFGPLSKTKLTRRL